MFNATTRLDYEQTYQELMEKTDDDRRKNYGPGRSSYRPARRNRRKKNASHPGCGIGARRNRRWNW